jgi:SAM-dependent methyltransferase
MVSYAKNNSSDERIEYFVQDISVPFENLDERLKNLEGKVDLVWSNRVLHWLPEALKETAVKTIARLLKPGGRCYVNLTIQRDLTEFSSDTEKKEIDKYFNFVPHEKQMNDWRQYFHNSNLSQVNFEFTDKSWTYGSEEQREQAFSYIEGYLEKYAKNDRLGQLAPEERKSLWKKMGERVVVSVNTAYGKDPNTYPIKTMTDHYGQFSVIGVK